MTTAKEKGDIGENAFEMMLREMRYVCDDVLFATPRILAAARAIGHYRRTRAPHVRDEQGRAIADFDITTGDKSRHVDVKCHSAWHRDDRAWQAGIGGDLLRDYQARAREADATAQILLIKRGHAVRGSRSGEILPHHPSPAGVWTASVDELIERGFEREIPGERGMGICSYRAIDGGVWHPFAPWDETNLRILYRRGMDEQAWDRFFGLEREFRAELP